MRRESSASDCAMMGTVVVVMMLRLSMIVVIVMLVVGWSVVSLLLTRGFLHLVVGWIIRSVESVLSRFVEDGHLTPRPVHVTERAFHVPLSVCFLVPLLRVVVVIRVEAVLVAVVSVQSL